MTQFLTGFLFVALGAFIVVYVLSVVRDLRKRKREQAENTSSEGGVSSDN